MSRVSKIVVHVHDSLYLHTAAVCVLMDDLYLHVMLYVGCAHVHKAHGGAVDRRGQQNTVFGTLVGLTKRFEAQ
jgi:hypothetical protein